MRLLLDTCALIWWFEGNSKLPAGIRSEISATENDVFVSGASAWEIANKSRLGKLPNVAQLVSRFDELIVEYRFQPLSITVTHGVRAGLLDGAHKDPFDRMIAAQALVEDLDVVTLDPKIAELGAKVVW